jgi:hypothetical protein
MQVHQCWLLGRLREFIGHGDNRGFPETKRIIDPSHTLSAWKGSRGAILVPLAKHKRQGEHPGHQQ